jgi:uncharacterized BrkB/YihY/UPF0761 family membrane protein
MDKSLLPVGVVASVVLTVATAAWTGSQWKTALDANTNAIQKLSEQMTNVWMRRDMAEFATSLEQLNKDLRVPKIGEHK